MIFLILTFFSIGLLSDFKSLWSAGVGKFAAVYVVSLFGFVIWVGLLIVVLAIVNKLYPAVS